MIGRQVFQIIIPTEGVEEVKWGDVRSDDSGVVVDPVLEREVIAVWL